MGIDPIHRNAEAIFTAATTSPAEQLALQREIIQAVKALNGAEMMGQDNELQFQIGRQTRRMAIRVVRRKTGEVIAEAAPEDVLRLAGDLRREEK